MFVHQFRLMQVINDMMNCIDAFWH